MSNNIQVSNQFEPSGVIFSALKKNKNGGKSVVLTRSDKKKLYLQLPFMRSPFGLSAFTDESTNKTSYSLDLSFDNDNEEAQELANKLRELDEIILNTVATNSKEWLGKKYDINVIREALYKPLVRQGKEGYADTLKLKVQTNSSGEFVSEVYNSDRDQISMDQIERGQKCMCIVEIGQVWFIDNKFGVSVRLSQVLCGESNKLPKFAFQGLDNDEDYVEEIMNDLIDE
mgnify:FL=1|jgi:hypothetical protein|tara:strand:+ start:2959 stop:3645 length:687 start_codon:yes stop_codon:yes gene_type:complete